MRYDESSVYREEQRRYGVNFILAMKKAYHRRNILPFIARALKGKTEVRILEFGPGLGVLTALLFEKYPEAEYHMIDIDQSILARLQQCHPQIQTHCLNSVGNYKEELNGEFDLIVAVDVWEHLPREQLEEYTRYSLKLLGPDGLFLAQVPNLGCPSMPGNFATCLTHRTPFNEFSARQLLLNAGAENHEIRILPYHFPSGLIGSLRELIRWTVLKGVKLVHFLLGVPRLQIMTPNLLMLVQKSPVSNEQQNGV